MKEKFSESVTEKYTYTHIYNSTIAKSNAFIFTMYSDTSDNWNALPDKGNAERPTEWWIYDSMLFSRYLLLYVATTCEAGCEPERGSN